MNPTHGQGIAGSPTVTYCIALLSGHVVNLLLKKIVFVYIN